MQKLIQQCLKLKVLHVLYWGYSFYSDLHLLQVNRPDAAHVAVNYVDALRELVFQVLAVYTTLYGLFPRLFIKGRYGRFVLFTIFVILAGALLSALTPGLYIPLLMPHHAIPGTGAILFQLLIEVFNIGGITLVFVLLYMAQYYYLNDKRNKQIEKERIITELDFLKAQINPHFLFNALNSIYVLMKEDIRKSEQTLLRFSSLLRYQLYDCSSNSTTLEKEIGFLNDFVALEKTRNGDQLLVNFNVPSTIPYFQIAPFILIAFVENAFKHISHFSNRPNRIDMNFYVEANEFNFSVANTCDRDRELANPAHKGIGLQNVQRRLELLYPGKHRLSIKREEEQFFVTLSLTAHDN